MATDLSLLMPRPETTEKEEIRRRAGEIERTEVEKRAKSSAKAKGRMLGSLDKKQRRIVSNNKKERGERTPLLNPPEC